MKTAKRLTRGIWNYRSSAFQAIFVGFIGDEGEEPTTPPPAGPPEQPAEPEIPPRTETRLVPAAL